MILYIIRNSDQNKNLNYMKKYINIFLLTILTFIFSSCFKQKANQELKTQQILSYINDLQLNFDTLGSGILLHNTFTGIGRKFRNGDKVWVCFTGIYLDPKNGDNNGKFADNDTFLFSVGNREVLRGWNELITHFAPGGTGIAIFPYDKAYGNEHTPIIPANCSLVYYFRIISDDYIIDQSSLFWQYTQQYDSLMEIFGDSLVYVKYFDGLGPIVNSSGANIEYELQTVKDSLVDMSDFFTFDFNDPNLPEGFKEGVALMSEGEMGKIIIPPYLSFTSANMYNLAPFTSIYCTVRVISADHEIEQKSKINKYLYVNNVSPDTIIPTGIYFFKGNSGSGDYPTTSASITLSDSVYLVNQNTVISSCQNCTKTLNSINFTSGQMKAIKSLKPGGNGVFILPYSEAYGSSGFGAIPPYATLVYKVKLIRIN